MRIGFRLDPSGTDTKSKRLISYVKLYESLQNVRDALLVDIRKTSSVSLDQLCVAQPQEKLINNDAYGRLQRMMRLLLKLLEMRTAISKALKEIRHLKYEQGAVDFVDVEDKAEQVNIKIENLLSRLGHVV